MSRMKNKPLQTPNFSFFSRFMINICVRTICKKISVYVSFKFVYNASKAIELTTTQIN